MTLPSGASREVWNIAGDLKWALRQIAPPFPEEPIGLGAKWTIDRTVEQDGVHAQEVVSCEVTRVEKELVTVKTDLRQRAAPQRFRTPGSHTETQLTEFSAEGGGEITWDLTSLIPRSAKTKLTETKRIQYEVEGQRATAITVTRRSLTIPVR
jgi:hypothetical protein